jgi:hypothetical protein
MMLISVLAEKTPFMKEFGQVCDAWKDTVKFLNTQCINSEDLVYEKGISLDTMQHRWKQYIALVKRFQARVLRDTGTDNKVIPPLLYELEDLYNNWQSFTAKQISKKMVLNQRNRKIWTLAITYVRRVWVTWLP